MYELERFRVLECYYVMNHVYRDKIGFTEVVLGQLYMELPVLWWIDSQKQCSEPKYVDSGEQR